MTEVLLPGGFAVDEAQEYLESRFVRPCRAAESLIPNHRHGPLPQPAVHATPPAPPACIPRTYESCHRFPACPLFATFEETGLQSRIPRPMPRPNRNHPPASFSRQHTAPFSAPRSIFPAGRYREANPVFPYSFHVLSSRHSLHPSTTPTR